MGTEDRPTSPAESAPTTIDSPDAIPTRTPASKALIGEVLNRRYVIESELKRGGMGVVYLARDQQLHKRPVVVKVLLDDAYQSEYVVQKFRQEVEALSRIDHPGIVGIIDAGELRNGRPFIVMQYVEGVTLRSLITPEGVNLERTGEILKQIGRALAAAHQKGILHRDLKPENIMLQDLGGGEEQIKIIDFGIAKVKDSVIAPSTSLDLSPGTVAYMAPEQLSGRPITSATDIFALGTIAYEMVTGRKPFNPETGYELLQMQQAGVRVSPADLRPSLPEEAEQIILKSLAFNPADRVKEPKEFGDGISRALSEVSVESVRLPKTVLPETELSEEETPFAKPGSPQRVDTIPVPFQPAASIHPSPDELGFSSGRSARRKAGRTGTILIALIVLVAIGGGVAWLLLRSRDEQPTGNSPVAQRTLNYGLTVQKMRDGKPYQDTFESSGQEIFESGWKFRMNVNSPEAGYLYLLNEGPAKDGDITYNMLFPAPSNNSGSPSVAANQKIESGWMLFDENQGTEKFWIIWSDKAVPELEAVKGVMNDKDKGAITDTGQISAIRDFIKANHDSSKPETEKDKSNKQTVVKGKGDTLVHLVELEHH